MRSLLLACAAALALLATHHPSFGQADRRPALNEALRPYLNKEGKLTPEAMAAINRDLELADKSKRGGPNRRQPANAPREPASAGMPVAARPQPLPARLPPRPEVTSNVRQALLLRDYYSAAAFISENNEVSKNGASFSYTADYLTNSYTFVGKGSLFYAIYGDLNINAPAVIGGENPPLMTYFSFVPGIEWNITSKKNRPNAGSLSARTGLELEIQSGGFIENEYLRVHSIYTTDVATDTAKLYGIEMAWQPVAPRLFIGGSFRASEALNMWVSIRPTLNVDYFYAGAAGGFRNLITGNEYLWAGPKTNVDLYFLSGPLKPFVFYLKHVYLYEGLNNLRANNVDHITAGTKIKLLDYVSEVDPTQLARVSLDFRFSEGRAPRTLDRESEFYAGISLVLGDLAK